MKPAPDRIEQLLNQALELGPDQRDAFLLGACGSDRQLRKEVETLLQAHAEAEGFLTATPTALAAPVPERAGTMIGRYKVLQQIGEGGFGVVYMAEQKEPVKRRVALKIIKLGMDTKQVVARFEAERQALALMDHPNIAKVLDGGATESGRPYFVMELVKGVPITNFCDENNLSTQERLELFMTVCHAIQHAHQKGIIHRDIKPSNILVTLHDGKPVPKVIDFGIAKATQQELTEKTIFTQFQQMIGTPAYMSPEQAEMSGLDIDTRTDIYSLGVLLYELLTGKTPLDAKLLLSGGYDEIRRRIKEDEPPRPSTRVSTMGGAELTANAKGRRLDPKRFAAQLRGDLDWIVMRALEKDRTRRYDNANNLADDIVRHLRNEPVLARPPSTAYRFQKMVRRNKLAVTAVTAVAVALIIGLCVATWSLVRERNALRSERKARQAAVEARAAEAEQRRLAVEQRKQAEQYLYAADMLLAQQALGENNLGQAVDLLQRHIPGHATNASQRASVLSSSRDLRDWEWRYFWREARSEELDELRPAGADWVAFAPEDDVLALAGLNKVSVWRTSPKRKLAEFPQASWVRQIAISSDGVLAALIDNEVKLWNVARDNAPLAPLFHEEAPFAMAFSADGRFLASAGTNQLWLWDLSTRRAKPIQIADGARLAFSLDGTVLAVTQRHADQLILWDLSKDAEIGRLPSVSNVSGGYGSMSYSPDGRFLAAAFGPGCPQIRIWDVVSGKVITDLVGHTAGVFACAFAEGGKLLASAGGDQTIKLWDVATWAEVRTLRGHRDMVISLTVSSDGTILATADKSAEVKLWKVRSSPKPDSVRFFSGIKNTWPAARAHWALSSDGRHAVTADTNGAFTVWKTATLQPLVQAAIPCPNLARVAIASPQLLAFADENGTLQVGSPKGFAALPMPSGSATNASGTALPSQCWGIAFSADGRKLAALSSDLTVAVWDTTIGHCLTRFEAPRLDSGLGTLTAVLAFSPGGELLAAGSTKGSSLVVWDLGANRAKWRLPEGKVYTICDCAFSPDGQQIATACPEGMVKLWNLNQNSGAVEPVSIGFRSGMQTSVAYSPNGRRLATSGDEDQSIRIWDTETWQEVARLKSEFDFFQKLAFLPDGNTLVGASQRELHVWRATPVSELVNR